MIEGPHLFSTELDGYFGKGVIVVDDEKAVRVLLKTALHRRGIRTWPASCGREALFLYRRHREKVGLVLLDTELGEMDGPGTLAALHEIDPDLKACFMSTGSGRHDVSALLSQGALQVFEKPFCVAEVCGFIENYLSELATLPIII